MSYIDLDKWFNDSHIYDYHIINNKYFIGKYDMLYGVRIRAGVVYKFSFNVHYTIYKNLNYTIECLKEIIEFNLIESLKPFEGLTFSHIKPIQESDLIELKKELGLL